MIKHKLFIANRGEIAIRIARTAYNLGIPTVGVFASDDAQNLHVKRVDEAIELPGSGSAAYLDIDQIIKIALESACTMLHPGYGFLSEQADFAKACQEAGLHFVGPQASVLRQFGDKMESKNQARRLGVPVIEGLYETITLESAKQFLESQSSGQSIIIKAKAGGGGRGMKIVSSPEDLPSAFVSCQAEAQKAFGNDELIVERYIAQAQHIEIQILGDGNQFLSFGERSCSIQRRHQKMIELSPAVGMPKNLLDQIEKAALKLAESVQLESLCTFEFLVEGIDLNDDSRFYFLEANPRIQVEHTVTEMRFGLDLVAAQLRFAMGMNLADQSITANQIKSVYDWAIQFRINSESYLESGQPIGSSGKLTRVEWPLNPNVRIDSHAYSGFENSILYDSLLAKVIVYGQGDANQMLKESRMALRDTQLEGLDTNLEFLQAILNDQELNQFQVDTQWLTRRMPDLLEAKSPGSTRHFTSDGSVEKIDSELIPHLPEGQKSMKSQMPGTVVKVEIKEGQNLKKGDTILIVEAMKMESLIQAQQSGVITKVWIQTGDIIKKGQSIAWIEPNKEDETDQMDQETLDPNHIRPDLQELKDRKQYLWDENRPKAVEKRAKTGQRTARANITDICDPDSFKEYGGLAVAAQRKRRKLDDLIENTPADGLITGLGKINGDQFDAEKASAMVMAYDYTVLAGTQGALNHKKMDRMLHLAEAWKMPIILFAEGGGGRPGDVDFPVIAGLDVMTFALFARMSGKQARIAIVSRYCFAGNAALAGCADVIIATKDVSIGMGGPAMIEGGGLGVFHPKEVGPAAIQTQNGVIDVLVDNEAEAVRVAKKYLSYFQGAITEWDAPDQGLLRHVIPENRRRVYPIRKVIEGLVDWDSFLELRAHFGAGIVTGFARIEGRPIGIIANNPAHLGGAIDSEGADKMARFMQLCDSFGIPIVSLVDTPGIMVGPDAEKSGTVRHASRLFVLGTTLKVPYFSVVLRKGYGLGAMAMTAGSFHGSVWTVAWPTGEFGAMGLEGAVRLGFKKEIEQAGDLSAQMEMYDKLVAKMYQRGKGMNLASYLEIDDVIDPKDTRSWIITGLDSIPKSSYENGNDRVLDTW